MIWLFILGGALFFLFVALLIEEVLFEPGPGPSVPTVRYAPPLPGVEPSDLYLTPAQPAVRTSRGRHARPEGLK
ncbi:hypothetical protein ACIP96_06495 [Streptomyces nigra]|uniref:hypothetical protein n=1 Tax=Streptomyces nigra TaxID=1827580 RepID=UPI003820E77E